MQKSFKSRLEALEALEGPPAGSVLDNSPITLADQELLYMAISTYRATVDARGYLVRKERPIDGAISRCNAALARLVPRLRTLEEVDGWIRQLEDPDMFDEDELLSWAHWGLTKQPDLETVLTFAGGTLRASVSFPGAVLGYWTRIAARAGPLLKERGIVLLPLLPEDACAAIEAIDAVRDHLPAAL